MNLSPDESSLRDRFRELRDCDAAEVRDFTLVLELRRATQNQGAGLRPRAVALAFLGAAAAIIAGVCITMRPSPALMLDTTAMRLADWKSPTGFLLVTDFSSAQPE